MSESEFRFRTLFYFGAFLFHYLSHVLCAAPLPLPRCALGKHPREEKAGACPPGDDTLLVLMFRRSLLYHIGRGQPAGIAPGGARCSFLSVRFAARPAFSLPAVRVPGPATENAFAHHRALAGRPKGHTRHPCRSQVQWLCVRRRFTRNRSLLPRGTVLTGKLNKRDSLTTIH